MAQLCGVFPKCSFNPGSFLVEVCWLRAPTSIGGSGTQGAPPQQVHSLCALVSGSWEEERMLLDSLWPWSWYLTSLIFLFFTSFPFSSVSCRYLEWLGQASALFLQLASCQDLSGTSQSPAGTIPVILTMPHHHDYSDGFWSVRCYLLIMSSFLFISSILFQRFNCAVWQAPCDP